MPLKLSPVAEKQISEIIYAFGCTRSEAISHALESQNAFEYITGDQIINWLDDNKKMPLEDWQKRNANGLAKINHN